MSHVVLLGDSIFDNAAYVGGGPAVIDHLSRALPSAWRATLRAVDGAVVNGVEAQLARVPADATHLVVSAGGNDALRRGLPLLQEKAGTVADALTRLAAVRTGFRSDYRRMLDRVRAGGRAVTVCTVYDAVPGLGPGEQAGLALFNDVILGEAIRAGVPVIDLRRVCTEAADYATSPIEPSVVGGGKIAAAIVRAVTGHDQTAGCHILP